MRYLKNLILISITVFAVVTIVFIGCTLDCYASLILPVGVFLMCILWLILMWCANKEGIERSEDRW